MSRSLPLLAVVSMSLLLLALPQPILASGNGAGSKGNQLGVLRPFVSLPGGLAAEGLAIGGNHLFIGTISSTGGPNGSILAYDESGALVHTYNVPGFPVVAQVALRGAKLFAVVCTSFAPTAGGAVVEVDLRTGGVTTVASDPNCPNGLTIDWWGNMFITNILAGTISEVTPSGNISTFAGGPLLATAGSSNIGPNDIVFNKFQDALYVTNTGQNTIVKITMTDRDRSVGAITIFSHGPPTGDGLTYDIRGDLIVASPFTNSIYRVTPHGSVSPLTLDNTTESLNTPSNVGFIGHNLYITNLGTFGSSSSGGKIDVVTLPFSWTDWLYFLWNLLWSLTH